MISFSGNVCVCPVCVLVISRFWTPDVIDCLFFSKTALTIFLKLCTMLDITDFPVKIKVFWELLENGSNDFNKKVHEDRGDR